MTDVTDAARHYAFTETRKMRTVLAGLLMLVVALPLVAEEKKKGEKKGENKTAEN